MKGKRQGPARGRTRALAVLLTLALAAGLVLSAPAPIGLAYGAPGDEASAADVQAGESAGSGEITLRFPTDSAGNPIIELEPEQTQYDLYQVASAVRLSGYDAYAYCVDDQAPCYALIRGYLDEQGADWHSEKLSAAPAGYPARQGASEWLLFYYAPQTPSVDAWQSLVELLAEFYLTAPADGEEDRRPAEPDASKLIGETAQGLSDGLYFAVIHGKDMKPEDYIVAEHPMTGTNYRMEKEQICTLAYSPEKVYYFQPQLISLPGRVDAAGEVTANTAQPGEWVSRVNAFTKGAALPRYADLELVKTLEDPGTEPATFIFRIAAYAPEDTARTRPIYEKMVSVDYNGRDAIEPVLLTNVIPVGSTVVITEEYSGAGYEFAGAETGVRWNGGAQDPAALPELDVERAGNSVIIANIPGGRIHVETPTGAEHILPDGTVETVTITNADQGGPTPPHGGSVVNRFASDGKGGWTWSKRSFDKTTGGWTETEPQSVTPETP